MACQFWPIRLLLSGLTRRFSYDLSLLHFIQSHPELVIVRWRQPTIQQPEGFAVTQADAVDKPFCCTEVHAVAREDGLIPIQ